jgi:CRP/FNR family transcriptional regulator, cyclic AMP receptor protein
MPSSVLEGVGCQLMYRASDFSSAEGTTDTSVLNYERQIQSTTTLECAMQEVRIELLQRMPIFGGIRTEILQFLLALCPIVSVPTSEFFFREHDHGDSMFVLEVGKAAVLKSCRGQDYLLQTLKEGDCFGEMAVMDYCPRSASVRAVEDCIAIRISAASLYEVYAQDLKQFSLIQMNMGREVCRRLREADNRLFGARMGTPEAAIGQVFLAD